MRKFIKQSMDIVNGELLFYYRDSRDRIPTPLIAITPILKSLDLKVSYYLKKFESNPECLVITDPVNNELVSVFDIATILELLHATNPPRSFDKSSKGKFNRSKKLVIEQIYDLVDAVGKYGLHQFNTFKNLTEEIKEITMEIEQNEKKLFMYKNSMDELLKTSFDDFYDMTNGL